MEKAKHANAANKKGDSLAITSPVTGDTYKIMTMSTPNRNLVFLVNSYPTKKMSKSCIYGLPMGTKREQFTF
jgi:hypothetical protein